MGQREASDLCSRQVGRWPLDLKTEWPLRCLLAKDSWQIKCNYYYQCFDSCHANPDNDRQIYTFVANYKEKMYELWKLKQPKFFNISKTLMETNKARVLQGSA